MAPFLPVLFYSLNLLIHTIFLRFNIFQVCYFLQYLFLLYHPLPLFSIYFYTIWTRRRRLVTVRRQVNGIAPDTDTPFHQLLSRAYEQMYLAKQRLKAKIKRQINKTLKLSSSLSKRLRNTQKSPFYKFDCYTDNIKFTKGRFYYDSH